MVEPWVWWMPLVPAGSDLLISILNNFSVCFLGMTMDGYLYLLVRIFCICTCKGRGVVLHVLQDCVKCVENEVYKVNMTRNWSIYAFVKHECCFMVSHTSYVLNL